MTIKQKLLLFGGAGLVPVIAVGITGWQAVAELNTKTRAVLTSTVALRNHWEADMMHDGLRADVYSALIDETAAQKAKSRSAVREDADRLREAVARNRRLSLDPEIVAALNDLVPRLEAYISEAIGIVDLAQQERASALSRIPNFQQAFESLESAQNKVSDLIVDRQQRAAGEAEQAGSARKRLMTAILLFAVASLGIAIWFIAGSIARSFSAGLKTIRDGSRQVAAAATQIASASQTLAQAASVQAASLEETSASAEEIRATTKQNADRSVLAGDATQDAVEEMARAGEAVTDMVASMNEIVESASKIEKIIKVIEEIAFQTNILALNAAVEAARAGEAGMGFAVVADEVRNLAHRSAEAAKNTAELIQESISRSQNGKVKLDSLSAFLISVRDKASRIHALSEEVTASSTEQSQSINGIARGISALQTVTQDIAANAEEHAAASEELTAQAARLDATITTLAQMVGSSRMQRGSESGPSAEPGRGIFEWDTRFELGIASIDAQHKKLFELAHSLHAAMKGGKGREVLSQLLRDLIAYTEYHFKAEEQLMRGCHYPDFGAHKEKHDALTRKVRDFAVQFEAGRAHLSADLLTFLRDWLYQHISKSDRQYAPYAMRDGSRDSAGAGERQH